MTVDKRQRTRLENLVSAARGLLFKATDAAAQQGLDEVELTLAQLWVDVMAIESALLLAQHPKLRQADVDYSPPGGVLPF